MLSPPPDESQQADAKQVNNLIHSILSYDTNIMLAAIISLLLVILFVLLLHVYAKWFLAQAARQGGRRAVSVPQVLGAHFHHHFHAFGLETTLAGSPAKGLAPSLISSIPSFIYKIDEHKHGLECVICLTVFENEEMGRNLPKCNHAFHVECIDMWLHSHTTCPICRAPVVSESNSADSSALADDENLTDQESIEMRADELRSCNDGDSTLEIIVEVPSSPSDEDITTSDSASSSEAPSSLGGSLKRMMSRSKCERKVHPSGNANIESIVSEKE